MRYLILLCLFASFNVFSETSLWRISKGQSELFVGGTIHLLSASDYPLPIEFERAYTKAEKLVLETDLAAMAKPEVQLKLLQRVMYQKGQSLKQDINPKTYQALVKHATKSGLDMNAMNQFKSPMVVLTIVMAELQRLGMSEIGVDEYFNKKAVANGKSLGALETIEVQLNVIANMGKGHEDEMILSTIAEMQELSSMMGAMKQAWRTGDEKSLEAIGIDPMKLEFPALYQLLLIDRNNAWLPKIEQLLQTPEVEFVLVGALHLIGHDGVISKLQAMGYTVEKFK